MGPSSKRSPAHRLSPSLRLLYWTCLCLQSMLLSQPRVPSPNTRSYYFPANRDGTWLSARVTESRPSTDKAQSSSGLTGSGRLFCQRALHLGHPVTLVGCVGQIVLGKSRIKGRLWNTRTSLKSMLGPGPWWDFLERTGPSAWVGLHLRHFWVRNML